MGMVFSKLYPVVVYGHRHLYGSRGKLGWWPSTGKISYILCRYLSTVKIQEVSLFKADPYYSWKNPKLLVSCGNKTLKHFWFSLDKYVFDFIFKVKIVLKYIGWFDFSVLFIIPYLLSVVFCPSVFKNFNKILYRLLVYFPFNVAFFFYCFVSLKTS